MGQACYTRYNTVADLIRNDDEFAKALGQELDRIKADDPKYAEEIAKIQKTFDEKRKAAMAEGAAKCFAAADKNGDKTLSKEEMDVVIDESIKSLPSYLKTHFRTMAEDAAKLGDQKFKLAAMNTASQKNVVLKSEDFDISLQKEKKVRQVKIDRQVEDAVAAAKEACKKLSDSKEFKEKLFKAVDTDNDNKIQEEEFKQKFLDKFEELANDIFKYKITNPFAWVYSLDTNPATAQVTATVSATPETKTDATGKSISSSPAPQAGAGSSSSTSSSSTSSTSSTTSNNNSVSVTPKQ